MVGSIGYQIGKYKIHRRLLNWPIQSHGSEILRRAMIDLDPDGFEISGPLCTTPCWYI